MRNDYRPVLKVGEDMFKQKRYADLKSNEERVDKYLTSLQRTPVWNTYGFTPKDENYLRKQLTDIANKQYPSTGLSEETKTPSQLVQPPSPEAQLKAAYENAGVPVGMRKGQEKGVPEIRVSRGTREQPKVEGKAKTWVGKTVRDFGDGLVRYFKGVGQALPWSATKQIERLEKKLYPKEVLYEEEEKAKRLREQSQFNAVTGLGTPREFINKTVDGIFTAALGYAAPNILVLKGAARAEQLFKMASGLLTFAVTQKGLEKGVQIFGPKDADEFTNTLLEVATLATSIAMTNRMYRSVDRALSLAEARQLQREVDVAVRRAAEKNAKPVLAGLLEPLKGQRGAVPLGKEAKLLVPTEQKPKGVITRRTLPGDISQYDVPKNNTGIAAAEKLLLERESKSKIVSIRLVDEDGKITQLAAGTAPEVIGRMKGFLTKLAEMPGVTVTKIEKPAAAEETKKAKVTSIEKPSAPTEQKPSGEAKTEVKPVEKPAEAPIAPAEQKQRNVIKRTKKMEGMYNYTVLDTKAGITAVRDLIKQYDQGSRIVSVTFVEANGRQTLLPGEKPAEIIGKLELFLKDPGAKSKRVVEIEPAKGVEKPSGEAKAKIEPKKPAEVPPERTETKEKPPEKLTEKPPKPVEAKPVRKVEVPAESKIRRDVLEDKTVRYTMPYTQDRIFEAQKLLSKEKGPVEVFMRDEKGFEVEIPRGKPEEIVTNLNNYLNKGFIFEITDKGGPQKLGVKELLGEKPIQVRPRGPLEKPSEVGSPVLSFWTSWILENNSGEFVKADQYIDKVKFSLSDIRMLDIMHRLNQVPGLEGLFDNVIGDPNKSAIELRKALDAKGEVGNIMASKILAKAKGYKGKMSVNRAIEWLCGGPTTSSKTPLMRLLEDSEITSLIEKSNSWTLTSYREKGGKIRQEKEPRIEKLKHYVEELASPKKVKVFNEKTGGIDEVYEWQATKEGIQMAKEMAPRTSDAGKLYRSSELTDSDSLIPTSGKAVNIPSLSKTSGSPDEITLVIVPQVRNPESKVDIRGWLGEMLGPGVKRRGISADVLELVQQDLGKEVTRWDPVSRTLIISVGNPGRSLPQTRLNTLMSFAKEQLAKQGIHNPNFVLLDNCNINFDPSTYKKEVGTALGTIWGNNINAVSYHIPGSNYEQVAVKVGKGKRGREETSSELADTILLRDLRYDPEFLTGLVDVKRIKVRLPRVNKKGEKIRSWLDFDGRKIYDWEKKDPLTYNLIMGHLRATKGITEESLTEEIAGRIPFKGESPLGALLREESDLPGLEMSVLTNTSNLMKIAKNKLHTFELEHNRMPNTSAEWSQISHEVASYFESMQTPENMKKFKDNKDLVLNAIHMALDKLKPKAATPEQIQALIDSKKSIEGEIQKGLNHRLPKDGFMKSLLFTVSLLSGMAGEIEKKKKKER